MPKPDIAVELTLENERFKRQLRESMGDAERSLSGLADVAGLTSKALAGIGAGLSIGALGAFVKEGIDAADQMSKMAQRAGVTTEAFSRLSFAAELADVSSQSLQNALALLGRKADEAARGGQAAGEEFRRLGVSVTTSNGSIKSVETLFADVAEAISKLPDGAEKSARAMALLGRSGAQLVPLLNGGAAGLRAAGEEAQRFGLVVTEEAGRAAEQFNDDLTRLAKAAQGVAIQLAGDLVPGLANLSTEFVRAYTEGEGLLRVFTSLGTAISRALEGNDQEKLGGLLLEEIELEKRIANLSKTLERTDLLGSERKRLTDTLKDLEEKFERTKRQAEGLRAALKPEQYGAAPASPTAPRATARIVEDEIASKAAAKAAQTERERILKAQESALSNLRKQLELQGENNELAKIEADIRFGTARDFDKATQDELRNLADKVDRLNEEAEVHEYLIKLEAQRREEAAKTAESLAQERAKVIESLRTPEEQYAAEVRRLMDLGLGGEDLQRGIDKAREALESARDKTKETSDAARELGFAFQSAFEDAIIEAESFEDVLKGLLEDLVRIGLRETVTDPLADAFRGLFSGGAGAGLVESPEPGFFERLMGTVFGGFRAGGGATLAGRAYVVGERGPELWVPSMNGSVIPNGALGGGNTVVNVINPPAQPSVRETVIDGEKRVDIVFQTSLGRSMSRGDLASAGLRPPLASR